MKLKTTRNAKGSYDVTIAGEKVFIEHGCDGWFVRCSYSNSGLSDLVDESRHDYPTKKECMHFLEWVAEQIRINKPIEMHNFENFVELDS